MTYKSYHLKTNFYLLKHLETSFECYFNKYFIVHGEAPRNNIEAEREKDEIEDSDENLVVLEKEERKVLRKCNIWRRQNING